MELISIAIAVVALFVSIYSVYESKKNNLISQEPHIVAHEVEGDIEYIYQITNKGGGPAFFKKVDYYFNLENLEGENFRPAIKEVFQNYGIRFKSTIMKFGEETIMAPGETFEIIKVTIHPEDKEKINAIPDSVFGVKVKYASAHGKEKIWVNDERLRTI